MKSIDSQYLIDPKFTSVTDQALSKDQVIDIYLHNFHGATSVSGGVRMDRKLLVHWLGMMTILTLYNL